MERKKSFLSIIGTIVAVVIIIVISFVLAFNIPILSSLILIVPPLAIWTIIEISTKSKLVKNTAVITLLIAVVILFLIIWVFIIVINFDFLVLWIHILERLKILPS